MKKYLIATAMAALLSNSAFAAKIGVSMDKFDDNFLTVLRNGMADYAKTLPGVTLQIEDAKDDVSKQLSQVQNFIANKRRRDHRQSRRHQRHRTRSPRPPPTPACRSSTSIASRPTSTSSDRRRRSSPRTRRSSGTLETKAICKLLGGKGDILVIEGELSNQAAVQRTKDIHEVIATPECSGMKIIAEQTAEWDRTKGAEPDDQLAVEGHEV